MTNDKNVIGVASELLPVLENAMDTGLFAKELDVAKFCIALAIRLKREARDMANIQTKWNVGTFDRDGLLRNALEALFPDCEDPYRKSEQLLQEGLVALQESQSGTASPDILGLMRVAADQDA